MADDTTVIVIQEPLPIQVTISAPEPIIVTMAEQGPPGPVGSGEYILTAGMDVGGHKGVYQDTDGFVRYASADDLSHASLVLGISVSAASTGDNVRVIRVGDVTEPSWNWVGRSPVYLGIDGVLTQVQPSKPGSQFTLVIGIPISQTRLFVDVSQPIVLF